MNRKIQAVIMVAGKSTRCYPLTLTRPKPLLPVANRTILEHNLSALEGLADEAILIIGYMGDAIKSRIGDSFGSLKIKYVEQKEQRGTANAALQAENLARDRFILMNGDDIFSSEDIKACIAHKYAVLAAEVQDPKQYGVIDSKEGRLVQIEEKPSAPKSNLVNPGFYLIDTSIFQLIKELKPSRRGEYEITDAINQFSKTNAISVVKASSWLPTSLPWDLLDSNAAMLAKLPKKRLPRQLHKNTRSATIEENVHISGAVEVGEGTLIKSGTYIEGPVLIGKNCTIGPNSYIRPGTTVGDGCKIGQAVEIKNSIIMNDTKVPHLSYIGDSVIGEHVNIGAGTLTANLRHDHASIKSAVAGSLIDSGRRKLGTIIGDGASIAVHTSIYPGRKIWPGKTTRPGEIVKEDLI